MNSKKEVQHVYLVGAKSLGAYGGYETFVYKLTEYHQNKENIKYHVACKANGDGCMDESKFDGVTKINDHEFEFHNAHCFKIDVPQIGPAQAIYYDVAALKACCEHIKKNHIPHPIVYIMACRIGPFASHFYREIHKLGGTVYLNPDGHEWMRAKWSAPIRKYWKISEQMMVKYCDLAICDSVNIEKYIHECYDGKGIQGSSPKTTFIAYGADLTLSKLADDDEKLMNWYREKGLTKKDYYLVVGRFVPENSFEVMIREFMKSKSKKNFAIITNVNEKFLNELEEKLHFKSDKRIKFVGTVYDQELLKKIRENAYAYFHGHTVGGTNPSLIEALGSTDLNLLVDVGFNKEVAEDCALYWSRKPGSLAKLIDKADRMSADEIAEMGRRAKKRVAEEYTWDILYIYGCYMKERGKLLNNTVVTTVMSNFGLYKAFDEKGIGYAKTAVGDKYVYEYMAKNGCRIGGEQSGHIIFSKYASTGDGILTSLKMMEVMLAKKKPMSELAAPLKIYPQVLENVRVTDKKAAQNDEAVQTAVKNVAEALGDTGRILVRESGTEPVVRVMVEASDHDTCQKYVSEVVDVIRDRGYSL